MKTRKDKVVYYFYAPAWDDMNFKKRNAFTDECKRIGLYYELINVDTKAGAEKSVELGVRNVPTAIIYKNGKVVGREKGNYIHEVIEKYR